MIGERNRDEYVDTSLPDAAMYPTCFKKLPSPVVGCLISWEIPVPKYERSSNRIWVAHMAVVVSVGPLMIANRLRRDGEFVEREPFEVRNKEYSDNGAVFYLPKNMPESVASGPAELAGGAILRR
jgi:hypothetical protein